MKKVAVVALCACFSVQAEASVSAYLRAAAVGLLTNSDFGMHYSIDRGQYPDIGNTSANNKKHSIGNVGGEFALGIRKKFEDDWFLGGELNYSFKKAKHKRDLTPLEDEEGEANGRAGRVSYINIKHENEYGFSFRFGKYFNGYDVYGICGATAKSVDVAYSLDGNQPGINAPTNDITTTYDKRVWGMVFGLGASRKINNVISCSLEYKYKTYNSASKSVDWRRKTETFFGKPHDTSDRDFKVKSDSHELALGFTINF